jgi:hypothetical protein
MDRKRLFKTLAYLIFAIFILNFLASKFYWYSSIWWFDMPMHFLGGFWLGLVYIWFFSRKDILFSPSFAFFGKIILGVLLVGIAWEIFEFYFINQVAQNSFDLLDTLSDLFFDLSGGLCAILYIWKKQPEKTLE